jgi:hypothetical protein
MLPESEARAFAWARAETPLSRPPSAARWGSGKGRSGVEMDKRTKDGTHSIVLAVKVTRKANA